MCRTRLPSDGKAFVRPEIPEDPSFQAVLIIQTDPKRRMCIYSRVAFE